MKKASFILLIIVCLLLSGCRSSVAGKVYTYEKEGFGGDFTITIDEDGTFTYYEGGLSSYIGTGSWDVDGKTIHLSDTGLSDRTRNYYFRIENGSLVFDAGRSDRFTYMKIPDGGRFSLSEETG